MHENPAIRKLAAGRPPPATIVTDKSRDAIMKAELTLGAALSEDKLAASFGVSRTPVREALTALAHQGLIVIRPKRGSFVFLPSEQDISELREFRLLLGSKALAWSHARAKARKLASIISANEVMRTAIEQKNGLRSTIADAQFHDAFVMGCGNRDLALAYSAIAGRLAAVARLADPIRTSVFSGGPEPIKQPGMTGLRLPGCRSPMCATSRWWRSLMGRARAAPLHPTPS